MNKLHSSLRVHLRDQPTAEQSGKWYFREVQTASEITDSFDRIKFFFKKYPNLYYFLIQVISPVYGDSRSLNKFISEADGLILNIGSGNQPKRERVVHIDLIDYDNVDIVADIHNLPFQDNTIDAVMNIAVLEHVKEPDKVIREVYRILKPGGRIYSSIPFMQPFHASPDDYQRYTLPGIKYLHRDFNVLDSGVVAGPVSGLLWVFQETIASIFSFGSSNIRNILTIIIMLLTWPVKFLDLIFIHLKTAENTASVFYVIAEKNLVEKSTNEENDKGE